MDATSPELVTLTAAQAAKMIADGEISSEEYVSACIARIEAREDEVQAWTYFDAEHALAQARMADDARKLGMGTGPLHGVPVAIKDIVDTGDMPTQHGSPVYDGNQPSDDAALISGLRDAGAIILGKSVTTELAGSHPGKTRNPHNIEHTPGGSSSGSAAAVADLMAPLAVGSQTGGSVIRPASFCGVYGFKPTFGLISRAGVLNQSPQLDTMGVYARSIEDMALVTECMTAYDARDSYMWPRSRPPLAKIAAGDPPMTPLLAFAKTPVWDQAEDVTKEAFGELAEALGEMCDDVDLPSTFAEGWHWHRCIMFADIAKNYGPHLDKAPDKVSDILTARIEEGRGITAVDYNTAIEWREVLYAGLEEVFERYDAILTPASPGPAPMGLETTGDAVFNALWTYLGVPCVTIPLLEANGMPLGVQLVGPRRDDGRLLRTARWLAGHLAAEA